MWQEFVFTKDIVMEDEEEDSKAGITKEENRESIAAEYHVAEGYSLSTAERVTRLEMSEADAGTTADVMLGADVRNPESSRKSGTPYDDVFRTLLCDCDSLVLPVLNEVFGEHYTGEEKIIHSRNEHYINKQDGVEKERITDSSFKVIGEQTKNYLFECQSTPDSSMLVRIFEYATQIALDEGKKDRDMLEVSIPHSAVLYLRSTESTPDKMQMKINPPKGSGIVCGVSIVKLKDYSLDDIFDKNLLFLIPFYIFNYGTKKQLEELEEDEEKLDELKGDYCRIVEHLNKLTDDDKLSAYYRVTLLEMSGKVVDSVAIHYDKVRKGARETMGGTVLEYKAKTILHEGEIKKARRTADNLFRMNMPVEQIAKAVEVDISQVQEWLSKQTV